MDYMKKWVLIVFGVLFFVNGSLGQLIKGKIINYPSKKLSLLEYFLNSNELIDTAIVGYDGSFEFNVDKLRVGMYRIVFDNINERGARKDNYIEILYNNEPVEIITYYDNILDSMKVVKSEDTRIYYEYLKREINFNSKLDAIIRLMRFYNKNDKFYDVLKNEFMNQQDNISKMISRYTINENTRLANSIIRSKAIAMVDDDNVEESRFQVYFKKHYLDNVNFNDTMLLWTNVLGLRITNYFKMWQNNVRTQEEYNEIIKKCIDTIMIKSSTNSIVKQSIISFLINGFNYLNNSVILEHIYNLANEDSINAKGKINEEELELAKRKVEFNKKIKIGDYSPDIISKDIYGKDVRLSKLDAKYKLVLFWSGECPHCVEIMPIIRDFYEDVKKNNDKKLEILALSINTMEEDVLDLVKKQNIKWINIVEKDGWESKYVQEYGVYSTPTMVLIDSSLKVIGIPNSVEELKRLLPKN